MEFTLTITGATAEELSDALSRLTAVPLSLDPNDEPELTPAPGPIQSPAPAAHTAEPAPTPTVEPAPEQAEVTLDMLRELGRRLVIAKRSPEVQRVLNAHGARMLSLLSPEHYPAVHTELTALLEGADHAPA